MFGVLGLRCFWVQDGSSATCSVHKSCERGEIRVCVVEGEPVRFECKSCNSCLAKASKAVKEG